MAWTVLGLRGDRRAPTGWCDGGGAATRSTLCMLERVTHKACGTGAVSRASILIRAPRDPTCLPRPILNCRLLLMMSRFRPPKLAFPFSSRRALMMTLSLLAPSCRRTLPCLAVAWKWPSRFIRTGQGVKCLPRARQRRRARTAAGVSRVIRPLVAMVPKTVWRVILAPLKFILL